jgi:hypothetical protein
MKEITLHKQWVIKASIEKVFDIGDGIDGECDVFEHRML